MDVSAVGASAEHAVALHWSANVPTMDYLPERVLVEGRVGNPTLAPMVCVVKGLEESLYHISVSVAHDKRRRIANYAQYANAY